MKRKLESKNKLKLILAVTGVVLAGFLIWFVARVLLVETELTVNTLYDYPEARSVKGLAMVDVGDYAVAVDGKVVGGKSFETGENDVRPTASTAKMILGLAVMREKPFVEGEVGETIAITDEMYERYLWYASHNGSNTRVRLGGEMSEYDALVSILLASSNNMADSLAIWAFGSIDNYREYATKMLEEWGFTHTTIGEDASGFSATTTSTAAELAAIGEKVMRDPVLSKIVVLKSYEIPMVGKIENTNRILGELNIAGVKTGYIGDASGYCLISGYLQDNHIVTVSLMGATTRQSSFDESLMIVGAMQEATRAVELVKEGQAV